MAYEHIQVYFWHELGIYRKYFLCIYFEWEFLPTKNLNYLVNFQVIFMFDTDSNSALNKKSNGTKYVWVGLSGKIIL